MQIELLACLAIENPPQKSQCIQSLYIGALLAKADGEINIFFFFPIWCILFFHFKANLPRFSSSTTVTAFTTRETQPRFTISIKDSKNLNLLSRTEPLLQQHNFRTLLACSTIAFNNRHPSPTPKPSSSIIFNTPITILVMHTRRQLNTIFSSRACSMLFHHSRSVLLKP